LAAGAPIYCDEVRVEQRTLRCADGACGSGERIDAPTIGERALIVRARHIPDLPTIAGAVGDQASDWRSQGRIPQQPDVEQSIRKGRSGDGQIAADGGFPPQRATRRIEGKEVGCTAAINADLVGGVIQCATHELENVVDPESLIWVRGGSSTGEV